jgi:hypothetical protein
LESIAFKNRVRLILLLVASFVVIGWQIVALLVSHAVSQVVPIFHLRTVVSMLYLGMGCPVLATATVLPRTRHKFARRHE